MQRGTGIAVVAITVLIGTALAVHLLFARRRAEPVLATPDATRAETARAARRESPPPEPAREPDGAAERRALIATAERLQAEIRTLERRPPAFAASKASGLVPPWKNCGRATPRDAVETLLWGIANGETATLADACVLDPAAQQVADEFYAALPESLRADFGNASELVATMMAARTNVAFKEAVFTPVDPGTANETRLKVRLTGGFMPREIDLALRRGADGWRLLVPAEIITGYRHLLLGSGPR